MRKNEAYKTLAFYMLSGNIEDNKINRYLMTNNPQILCRALDLIDTSNQYNNEPDYISNIKTHLQNNKYVEAIKELRNYTMAGLKETKYALDYATGRNNLNWDDLTFEERKLYDNYLRGYF